jgi:hypothetical protein
MDLRAIDMPAASASLACPCGCGPISRRTRGGRCRAQPPPVGSASRPRRVSGRLSGTWEMAPR